VNFVNHPWTLATSSARGTETCNESGGAKEGVPFAAAGVAGARFDDNGNFGEGGGGNHAGFGVTADAGEERSVGLVEEDGDLLFSGCRITI
jgi:hypothetical protein